MTERMGRFFFFCEEGGRLLLLLRLLRSWEPGQLPRLLIRHESEGAVILRRFDSSRGRSSSGIDSSLFAVPEPNPSSLIFVVVIVDNVLVLGWPARRRGR